ncbi:MAG: dethiobiotin synthase [Planctomycetota bacterium]|jgi:dethiobiotin synthase
MSKNIVITGTGTEIGKTYFGCLLAKFATDAGIDTHAIKPVESGCDGSFVEDGQLLANATGQEWPRQAYIRLHAPLAPCVAADLEGVNLDPSVWVTAIKESSPVHDLTLIETAGGLLSPLAWGFDTTHLARDLGAACIVVAANRLGCIHEIRTVLAVLRHEEIPVVSVILNSRATDQSSKHNLETLKRVEPDVPVFDLPEGSDLETACAILSELLALMELKA